MQKANVRPEQIRMIFAGDLLAQSIASSFGLVDLNCPLYLDIDGFGKRDALLSCHLSHRQIPPFSYFASYHF